MSGTAPRPVTALVEVTDTLRLPYVTGIQRTVRQVLAHWPDAGEVEVVPVVHTGHGFRRLTAQEEHRLRAGAVAPPLTGGRLRRLVARVPGARKLRDAIRRALSPVRHRRWGDLLVDMNDVSVLLELEATWWSPGTRGDVLPELRRRGIQVATVIYDLLLLRHPEWFDPTNRAVFVPWARAQLEHADMVLCYSQFVAEEVAHFAPGDPPPIGRFLPGADARAVPPQRPDGFPDDGVPFVLVLGTVEPRKNIDTVLDASDALARAGCAHRLVVAGREGWDVGATAARLRAAVAAGDRVVWLQPSDGEVEWLYHRAHVVAVPSFAEGYGLPVVEALRRGAPVVASDGGALAEVGAGIATYVDPDDADGWVAALRNALDAPRRTVDRRPPAVDATWAQAAAQIESHVADLVHRRGAVTRADR